jgi:hypothetical protein
MVSGCDRPDLGFFLLERGQEHDEIHVHFLELLGEPAFLAGVVIQQAFTHALDDPFDFSGRFHVRFLSILGDGPWRRLGISAFSQNDVLFQAAYNLALTKCRRMMAST